MEDKVVIDYIKSRIAVDENWWFNFLLGAALAEFSTGSYTVEETEK